MNPESKIYDHKKIEPKWQKEWEDKGAFKAVTGSKKPKKYALSMFPYPSGAGLHVGHPRGYIACDVYARLMRIRGFNVLHQMGFDSFGLPAEQYAIETGNNPKIFTDELVKKYRKQLDIIGFGYDWERQIATHRPEYYKWTQFIFLKLYDAWYNKEKNKAESIYELIKIFEKEGNKNVDAFCDADTQAVTKDEWNSMGEPEKQKILMKYRLAYEGYSEVNWCPELGTVLANDEIADGPNGTQVSERGGFPVEKKSLRQWFLRITAYADRLLSGLEEIDWPSHIKEIQKNWIGRSEGSQVAFKLKTTNHSLQTSIEVFTTRVDTLFGVTYVVIAPEHELVQKLLDSVSNKDAVLKYIEEVKNKTAEDRTAENKEKIGVPLKGVTAINPANGEDVPVWIADYVLASYGTGAVMAVPAHDSRDFAFAKKYNLGIIEVVSGGDIKENSFDDDGVLINSGKFDGLSSEEARAEITKAVGGKFVTKYKMRDAVFARQRYWGEPIPLIHKKDGTITALNEKDLPLELPDVKSYAPTGNAESPLSSVKEWIEKGYETNTMPGWAGSSWYFLRYTDPQNEKEFASIDALKYWGQVDMYVGGAEHSTGHLLYSRFWNKFLYDLGLVPNEEPFKVLRNQGMILGADHRKMSKRWGNVVNPDDVVSIHGADTLRVFEMFIGPFDSQLPWSTDGIIGSRRFIEKVWRLKEKVVDEDFETKVYENSLHKTIKKVGEDIESFNFNTAISAMMICLNEMEKSEHVYREDFEKFIQILSPFAPHITEEIWSLLGNKEIIQESMWPKYDPEKLVNDIITLVVQVNGKVRGELTVPKDIDEKSALELVRGSEQISKWQSGGEIIKVIFVPGRLINIVVKISS